MTTIAWDGRMLAADRCRTNGYGLRQSCVKLVDAGDYVFAICGMFVDKPIIHRWLVAGAKWEDRPELEEGGTAGLVVRKHDRAVLLIEGKKATLVEVPSGRTVSGSGGPYAIAAMACGKNAREAVEIASMFDESSGLGVDYVDFGESAKTDAQDDPKERPTVPRIEVAAPDRCQCGAASVFANGACSTCLARAVGGVGIMTTR